MHGYSRSQFVGRMIQMKMTSDLPNFNKSVSFEDFDDISGFETGSSTHGVLTIDLWSKDTSTCAVKEVVSGSGNGSPVP